ncbi:MAG TPA: alpha/beta fold hydrolase [Rhodospirillales bacterium]|nr:alpha/beta fold hydrolase [Rhodospirillales bacterium]
MTSPTLVLVHGWGFDESFWAPLMAALPEARCKTVALGSRQVVVSGPGPVIAVGHSLGFLWLLHEQPFAWSALVAINGFTRFIDGVAPRTLQRMIIGLERAPEKTVADFMALCGAEAPERLDVERLRQGLQWLMDWDAREALEAETAPVAALAGRSDPIVPAAASEAAFKSRLHWRDGGHLLPLTDPDWCAERIRECL